MARAKAKTPSRSARARPSRAGAAPAAAPHSGDSVRSRILGAAMDAFMERGYGGTSTLEIATRAKVSKREVYAAFGSKQAMLVECVGWGVQRMRQPLALPSAHDRQSLIATLAGFGANFLNVLLGKPVIALYRLALAEVERSPEIGQTLDEAGRGGARKAFAEMLAKAQASGLIGGDPETVTGRYFALLTGDWFLRSLMGVIAPPSAQEIKDRAQATAEALLTLFPPR